MWLALPALLVQALAEARWSELNQPRFVAAIALGMLATFVPWVALSRGRRATSLPDASIEALAASYPNTGFMGIPCDWRCSGAPGCSPRSWRRS